MFRVQPIAVLAAVLALICVTPIAAAFPPLAALYLAPVAIAAWVLRVRTTADSEGLVVRGPLRTTELPWDSLKGLRLTRRSGVVAVPAEGPEVPLPSVRVRHLPALSLVSGGRLGDPTAPGAAEAEAEPEREPGVDAEPEAAGEARSPAAE